MRTKPSLSGTTVSGVTTAVILNDLQIPFQDDPAVAAAVSLIKGVKPDMVILNGDVVDSYQLGEYLRNPNGASIDTERRTARSLMEELKHVPLKLWIEGNHEDRLRRFVLKHAPAFSGLEDFSFPAFFGLGKYGFHHRAYGDFVDLGRLMVTHGDIVRKHSAYTAKAHFDKYGCSVIHGHTHRLGSYYHTNRRGTHGAWENGCLCDWRKMDWIKNPDWQQGIAVVTLFDDGMYNLQQLPVINGVIRYGREEFRG